MTPGPWHRMDALARQLTPTMLTLALVVVNAVPMHIPGLARVAPVLPLIAVYHWAVFRPRLLPPVVVFFVGVLEDVLTGTPVGFNALVFLAVYGAVLSQKRFFTGKSFLILWLGFGLIAAGAAGLGWFIVSVLNVTLMEPKAVFFQYLLTLGCFPLLAWAFMRWQQAVLRQD